jgi:two-component system, chemotaxis family, chemotaxis protein CheY
MRSYVLVVDDDSGVRDLLKQALESEGYGVRVARDGREALEKVRARLPNVILLDLQMPGMDGLTFASRFRKDYPREPPIMCLSGSPRALQQAREIGAESFFRKPFELGTVLDEVARLVGENDDEKPPPDRKGQTERRFSLNRRSLLFRR